tara:strand:+ start:523 stop:696 length:174 start_codon:yes stop_codon:yes gene_type:complete
MADDKDFTRNKIIEYFNHVADEITLNPQYCSDWVQKAVKEHQKESKLEKKINNSVSK